MTDNPSTALHATHRFTVTVAEARYSTQTDPDPTERTHRFYRAIEE